MSWLLFSEHFDYRWESGAHTAYNAGGKYYVKREVEKAALDAKVAEKVEKPADDDPAYTAPPARHSSDDMTFAERRSPQKTTFAGHAYGQTGNPELLPDPHDPNAIHGEPMVPEDGGEAPDAIVEADKE